MGWLRPATRWRRSWPRILPAAIDDFAGTDLSTKLKLMGVDVASFGTYEAPPEQATPLVFEDPFAGVYKKLLFYARRHAAVGRHPGRRRGRLRQAHDARQE